MRKVITTEEYDGNGRLVKRIVTTEDDGQLFPQPIYPTPVLVPLPQPYPCPDYYPPPIVTWKAGTTYAHDGSNMCFTTIPAVS